MERGSFDQKPRKKDLRRREYDACVIQINRAKVDAAEKDWKKKKHSPGNEEKGGSCCAQS